MDVTTVIGPLIFVTFVLVKLFIKLLIKVVLPTFGGPTTAIKIGGGSSGVLSTNGICWRFAVISSLRRKRRSARTAEFIAKAFTFFVRSVGFSSLFLFFFFSALTP